jgi:hypothetical protein
MKDSGQEELKDRTFIGIVEDNEDPKKIGRCRVRVLDVFDEIPADQLPWSSPWKDLNGNAFNIPDKGKVVIVVFEDGNPYSPEYICAEHYNINLKTKLTDLSGADYTSMKSLIFDHKTQIYVNDKEGLKFDYKYNNINIKDQEINLNLKDNFSKVNIGTAIASQRAILGDHFLNWFDTFVENLLGAKSGPYLGNLGAPVVANPEMINCLLQYKALKEPKFLSHHINLVDNESVEKLDRVCNAQIGDRWKSTVRKNDLVAKEPVKYKPVSGQSTDTPPADTVLTPPTDANGNVAASDPKTAQQEIKVEPTTNEDIKKILDAMNNKNYKILTRPYEINIVGIRRQYEGMVYSNTFMDTLYAIYKDDSGEWIKFGYPISTIPGLSIKDKQTNKKVPLKEWKKGGNGLISRRPYIGTLMEAQYLNVYAIGEHAGAPAMITKGKQKAYRDTNLGDNTITYSTKDEGNFGMLIHRGYPGGSTVDNWSEGCQVFKTEAHLNHFFGLANKHKDKYGNSFNYTLMLAKDVGLT